LPTIVESAQLPAYPAAQGRSFSPLIKREKNFFNHFLWQLTRPFRKRTKVSFAETQLYKQNQYDALRYSVITDDGHQMTYNKEKNSLQLFNLKNDPLAQNNIAEGRNDITKHLLDRWEKLYDTRPVITAPTIDLTWRAALRISAVVTHSPSSARTLRTFNLTGSASIAPFNGARFM